MNHKVSLAAIALLAVSLSGCMSSEVVLRQEGSSTVLPLAEVWAEDFGARTGAIVNVAGGGSGHGASGLCEEQTLDLGDMSRKMKGFDEWKAGGEASKEVKVCLDNGITPLEWTVAFDGLSVVVNKDNTFANDFTTDELFDIFSGAVTKWNQIDESYPSSTIKLCIPDNESGTYEYFFEEIIEHNGGDSFASGAQQSADDNVLVSCISGDNNAIGFFGYAYLVANEDKLKAVAVDGVPPNASTIEDGSYSPLSRGLYVYTASEIKGTPVGDYIHYIMTDGQALVASVGYVPLSDTVKSQMLAQLDA